MADERQEAMSTKYVNALILKDEGGAHIIVDDCFVFEMLDGTGRRVNVPQTLIAHNQGSMKLPISNDTIVNLMFDRTEEGQPEDDISTSPTPSTDPTLGLDEGSSSVVAEWTESSAKLLIELYKNNKPLVDSRKIKTMKKMWEQIKQAMEKHGYFFTAQQCESKWKALERAYKKMIDNKKATGRGRKTCQFEKELGDILAKRQSIFPTLTMGTGSPISRNDQMQESGVSPDLNELEASFTENFDVSPGQSAQSTPSPTPVPSAASGVPPLRVRSVQKELQELRKVVEQRQADKLKLEEKKMSQKDELIKQLTLKNKLMERYLEAKLGINNPS